MALNVNENMEDHVASLESHFGRLVAMRLLTEESMKVAIL